jgi:hypothetical protein
VASFVLDVAVIFSKAFSLMDDKIIKGGKYQHSDISAKDQNHRQGR